MVSLSPSFKSENSNDDISKREIDFAGLAFDAWDIDFYLDLFVNKLKRDPTSVELFDLAQSNSEHSRHWFFKVNNMFL